MQIRHHLANFCALAARWLPRGGPSEAVRAKLDRTMRDLAERYPFWSAPDLQGSRWVSMDSVWNAASVKVIPCAGGSENWLVLCEGVSPSAGLKIRLEAGQHENTVIIGPGAAYQGDVHLQGSGGLVSFGGGTLWACDIELRLSTSKEVFLWGKGGTSNGLRAILEGEGIAAVIGDDCMFARDTHLATSDLHGIEDLATGNWLNPPKDVVIEQHVWVGQGAMIMKGVRIGADSIIGARAIVTQEIPANSIALGAPARVGRTGVRWVRERSP